MRTVVFYNMGNRDVRDVAAHRPIPRQHGNALLAEMKHSADPVYPRLSLPILDPALAYILQQNAGRIEQLVLFGTDQPETGATSADGIPFRERDTWPYTLVAQKLLKARMGGQSLQQIKTHPVQIIPSNYDEAFEAYGALLPRYAKGAFDRCYVIAAGGTPACNMGLLLQAIRLFGDRCHTLYQPERQHPFELRTGAQILDVLQTNAAARLLDRHDFAGAALLVDDAGLQAILHYADARAAFDFGRAQTHLQTAMRQMGAIRQFGQREMAAFRPLLAHSEPALIAELVANAALCWQAGRIVDFLGRCFRINEAVLHFLIHTFYPTLSTDGSDPTAIAALHDHIARDAELDHFLNQIKGRDGQPLQRDYLTRPLLLGLVRYAGQRGGGPFSADQVQQAVTILERIDRLSALRNKSIIAHGYRGVAADSVCDLYGGEPLDDCAALLSVLNITATNPFETVRVFIQEQL